MENDNAKNFIYPFENNSTIIAFVHISNTQAPNRIYDLIQTYFISVYIFIIIHLVLVRKSCEVLPENWVLVKSGFFQNAAL